MKTFVSHGATMKHQDELPNTGREPRSCAIPMGTCVRDQRLAETTLSRDDCLALLRTTSIGRVALSIDALPVVMPVNFAMFGDDIVFRPMVDEKLSRSAGDVVLAFQVDNFDLASHTGWSVLVQGVASEIVEAELIERCRALTRPPSGIALDARRFVKLATCTIAGRRVVALPT